jgi:hypothetical protein
MDSKERFNDNLKKDPTNKILNYYLDNPIEYSFNNQGFRTPDDFNSSEEGNVFLGCSFTMGIGLHLEDTWSYKLNQTLGGKFWNLSLGGSSIMTQFRVLYGFHDELKIKNVFHFAPILPRYEFFIDGTPRIISIHDKEHEEFYSNYLIDNEQLNLLYVTYTNAIKNITNKLGCNYYHLGYFPDRYDKHARDLAHPSGEFHNLIYNTFLGKIKNEDYNIEYQFNETI